MEANLKFQSPRSIFQGTLFQCSLPRMLIFVCPPPPHQLGLALKNEFVGNKMSLQRGLKYRTCSDFEWAKVVMLNGSKPDQPDHTKSDQIAVILDLYALALFLNGQDYSYCCCYAPNHSNN